MKNKMKILKILKILTISIISFILILFILLCSFLYWVNLFPKEKDYNMDIYSVVLHNNTSETISNIAIYYGCDLDDIESVYNFTNINDLNAHEYRKINIDTTNPSPEAKVPYNVWVVVSNEYGENYDAAGYFGFETGGFSLVEISKVDNQLIPQSVFESKHKYKRIYWRHCWNQQELSWYDWIH